MTRREFERISIGLALHGFFEGLTAYRTRDGFSDLTKTLFVCKMRLCMTPASLEQFVEAVKKTVLANDKRVPPPGKGALYIRPLHLGSGAILGVAPAPEYTFLIYVSPVGDYRKVSLGVNMKVDHNYHLAHSGGAGGVKSCTNCSPIVKSLVEARSSGFSDVLFLDAVTGRNIEEASTFNIFIVKVQERDVTVDELLEAEEVEANEKYANVNWEELGFSLIPTDYMYMSKCKQGESFSEGEIVPYGDIPISPCAGILNYGQGLFEGLKAYRTEDGRITLFRPDQNAFRMQTGADRLCMTSPSSDQFVQAVKKTVLANKKWVPPPGKGSLYIRPLLIGTGAVLGIASAPEYTFLMYASPVGNYHTASSGLNLIVDHTYRRAHTGGTGGVKSCTNYSPVVKPLFEAKSSGFSDILFLDAATGRNIEEVSTCNIFITKGNIVSTPPTSGTILPGITRKSISELARDIGYQVQERDVSVEELLEAEEVFCTGTAMVVKAVETVTFHDKKIKYRTGEEALSTKLHLMLTNIQMGIVEDKKSWMVEINGCDE
ncbi:LOW QUALITY PROTEIN: hypothetical protein HID58_057378 [Brassica napus]|uniref:Branched-chain-amino-acid aminotransferase n=1 Tax=Brassica napus TaxID=3708 RepID=A0ABQ8AQX7_BRANA|nr:LOW QUALITY PROTEIN: hypothetical protein HID58_057378 [Brassica napus]